MSNTNEGAVQTDEQKQLPLSEQIAAAVEEVISKQSEEATSQLMTLTKAKLVEKVIRFQAESLIAMNAVGQLEQSNKGLHSLCKAREKAMETSNERMTVVLGVLQKWRIAGVALAAVTLVLITILLSL